MSFASVLHPRSHFRLSYLYFLTLAFFFLRRACFIDSMTFAFIFDIPPHTLQRTVYDLAQLSVPFVTMYHLDVWADLLSPLLFVRSLSLRIPDATFICSV